MPDSSVVAVIGRGRLSASGSDKSRSVGLSVPSRNRLAARKKPARMPTSTAVSTKTVPIPHDVLVQTSNKTIRSTYGFQHITETQCDPQR